MRCYAWCNLLHPKSGIGHEKNLPRDDPRSIPPGTKICRGLSQIDARSTQLCPSVWCFFHENAPLLHYLMPEKGQVWAQKKTKHPDPCLSIESIHIQPLLPADSIMAANSYIPRSGPTLMPYLRNQGMSWGTVCHWAEAYAQMPRKMRPQSVKNEIFCARLQQPFAIWADLKWRPVAKPWVAWWEYTNQDHTGWFVSAPVTTTPFSAAPFSTKRPKSQIHLGPWRQGGFCTGIFPAQHMQGERNKK